MQPLAEPLVGDSEYRVTVPLPGSLKALNDSARRFFGYAGCIRLYLRGVFPIVSDQQLATIQDEDIIVITWDDHKLTNKQVSQMITTHQSDFVVPPRTEPLERELRKPEAYEPYRVTEQSAYTSSYVAHDPEPTRQPCSPRDMAYTLGDDGRRTGTTSYSHDYPPRALPQQPRGMRTDDPGRSGQFSGETTYNVMHTPQQLPGRPSPRHPANPSLQFPRKFEGSTTYSDHFTEKPLTPGPKGCPGIDDYEPHRLGNNTTEYKREYLEKSTHNPRVHLEPEVGKMDQK